MQLQLVTVHDATQPLLKAASTDGFSFAELEELKNLLIMHFMESQRWDWDAALKQLDINRKELGTQRRKRSVGFGTRTGGDQGQTLTRGDFQSFCYGIANCTAHLDSWPFASHSQSTSNSDDSTKELDRQDSFPFKLSKAMKNGFEMWNTTSAGFRRIMPGDCNRNHSAKHRKQHWENPSQ